MKGGAVAVRRELLTIVALFVLSLPAVTWRVTASDEIQYFAYLRSLWFDRDVSFDNEYRYFYDRGIARTQGFADTFLEPQTPTGLRENFGTIGSALLWAPFYGVADISVRLRRAAGSDVPADGYSRPYLAAVSFGSATLACAALVLSTAAARRLTGVGLPGGLAVWFGTPLLFYMYAAPAFAHAPSAFAVALFVTLWLRVRTAWSVRGFLTLGAAAALMAMVREQDLVYAAGPALDYLVRLSGVLRRGADRRGAWRWLTAPLAGAVAFFLAYTPQLLAYWSLNGRPGPSTLVTRKMTWTAPHALDVLASPHHGLFAWTPLAALAVAGLAAWWLRAGGGPGDMWWSSRAPLGRPSETAHPPPVTGRHVTAEPAVVDGATGIGDGITPETRLRGCLLLMLAMQVYVTGSVESWTVAGAFGQRRFVSATILLVIGLSALWQMLPRGLPRLATSAVVLLAVWWNVGLMALFGAGLMDRQRLTLRQNAYDVFITLPRTGPALVYRYFTDRDSFYGVR